MNSDDAPRQRQTKYVKQTCKKHAHTHTHKRKTNICIYAREKKGKIELITKKEHRKDI